MVVVTAFYAGLLALGFVWLSVRVIQARKAHHVAIGTGQHRLVERAIRAHGNFAEYVPLALLVLALLELNRLPDWGLHALGTALVVGRALHAHGIAREPENFRYRTFGMSLTFAVLGIGAAALLGQAVAGR
jgi:uncharacterized membrane protein YecN with MAPEG domain